MHLCTILVIDSTLILVDVLYFSDLYWKQAWEKTRFRKQGYFEGDKAGNASCI